MLPDFPGTKRDIGSRILFAIEQAKRAKAPLLAGIKTLVQHEGEIHAYDRIGATSVREGFEPLAVPFTVEIAEIPELVGEQLATKIEMLADQMARKEIDLFYRKLSESSKEVGTSLDARGAPLTQEMFFAMLEKVDMEFQPDGRPIATLDVSANVAAVLTEWDKDPSFKSKYEELLERKRDAWRDRESRRKLVD